MVLGRQYLLCNLFDALVFGNVTMASDCQRFFRSKLLLYHVATRRWRGRRDRPRGSGLDAHDTLSLLRSVAEGGVVNLRCFSLE